MKELLVLDLDNTLVDTEGYLKDAGLLPKDKHLYDNPIEDIIRAYVRADIRLIKAKPIQHVVDYALDWYNNHRSEHPLRNSFVVITSRLSVPIDITDIQVGSIFPSQMHVPVYVSSKKGATINSLAGIFGYEHFVIIDDKFGEEYSCLNVSHVYKHPDDLLKETTI